MNIYNFNKEAGIHQSEWRKKYKLALGENGKQNGVEYDYILPDSKWHLGLWQPARQPILDYVSVTGILPNKGKHNLKSSWTQCANLFFPFRIDDHMRALFIHFLSELLELKITSIDAIEFEYAAPGKLHPRYLLGESKGMRGSGQTSPDVAVLFGCSSGECGIYLIENKYTEHSFYDCSGFKKAYNPDHPDYLYRGLQPNPTPERCGQLSGLLQNYESMCHQVLWGRKYWKLLREHINEQVINKYNSCLAIRGGYQLFRQQALAQGILDMKVFDYVISGVSYDGRNETLINCLNNFGINDFSTGWPELFNTSVRFKCFTHQELVKHFKQSKHKLTQNWADYLSKRYDY